MGKAWQHLDLETLSALADRELEALEEARASAHVSSCGECAAVLATFARVDGLLLLLTAEEREWETLRQALATLPSGVPSAKTDRAIAALVRERPPIPTPLWPPSFGDVAVRGAVAAAVVLALVVGLLPGSEAPTVSRPPTVPDVAAPDAKQAFVAAVQTSVFHTKSNTLYVLQSAQGTVAAYNARTLELRASIAVGGRPSALALNAADDVVVVLDSTSKTLTEIDPKSNLVVASTPVDSPGTPTSVQVDETNGKYYVASVALPPVDQGPLPSPSSEPAGGQVTVIDTETKKIEQIFKVDVAPRLVVPDPSGQFTLLVAPDRTTMVDVSFNKILTLPGGIAAAFDARQAKDLFAILSENEAGSDVTFVGKNAPAALHFDGKPYAITAMPRGGFGVLLQQGSSGRIVVIGPNGKESVSVAVEAVGPTLDYDERQKRFTVTSDGTVASVTLSGELVAQIPLEPQTSAPPQRSGEPGASGAPGSSFEPGATAEPSASIGPGASAGPTAAPEESALPEPETTPIPLPSQPVREIVTIPADVIEVGDDFYRLPLPLERAPVLAARNESHLWFIDRTNGLNALDLEKGTVFRVAQLPFDASVRALAAGPVFVYAADIAKSRVWIFEVKGERLSSAPLPAVDISATAVAPGGTVWMTMPASGQLLSMGPISHRLATVNVGLIGISALAVDRFGRVWFASGAQLGYYDTELRRTVRLTWPGGSIQTLLVDGGDVVWAGTAQGEVWSVNDGLITRAAALGSPVTALTLDASGQIWYLAPGTRGFRYGQVSADPVERTVPGPAIGLALNSEGRAWLPDPLGGLFLGLGGR